MATLQIVVSVVAVAMATDVFAQLPVVSRLGTEPAAAFALNALFDEFVRGCGAKKSFRAGAWNRLVVELDAAGLDYLRRPGSKAVIHTEPGATAVRRSTRGS